MQGQLCKHAMHGMGVGPTKMGMHAGCFPPLLTIRCRANVLSYLWLTKLELELRMHREALRAHNLVVCGPQNSEAGAQAVRTLSGILNRGVLGAVAPQCHEQSPGLNQGGCCHS